jgi:hypothetical protein
MVCNRAGAVDAGNAKGFSLYGATAISSAAGECSLIDGVVSLIISSVEQLQSRQQLES